MVAVLALALAPAIACGAAEPPQVVPATSNSSSTAPAAINPPNLPTTAAAPDAIWPAPNPIVLPADDGPHQALTEWWYYNGHLRDPAGSQYGFELVVFKRQASGGRAGYVGHMAVTDHQTGKFQYRQELSLPPPEPLPGAGFDVKTASIRAKGGAGNDVLHGATADYQLSLNLRPAKPPVLHGRTGYIGVTANELSYYYSRTRLDAQGTLVDHGEPASVQGSVWMDHQWGDFSLDGGGGWDWLGVQLDDGNDLMVSVLRNSSGDVVLTYGTLVGPQGQTEHLDRGAVQLRATGRWVSPKTNITYPMGWVVEAPSAGLTLDLQPVILDQELDTRDTVGRAYWEGQVKASGQANGKPVAGLGYVELTGYPTAQSQAANR